MPFQRRGRDDRRPAGASGPKATRCCRSRRAGRRGRRRLVIVTDQPEGTAASRWKPASPCTTATSSTASSASCARSKGCTVIIYDQTCATEKRRRRKRGKLATPAKRVVINEGWCAKAAAICSVQSNCLSVEPVETEFGRKRRINQSTCNKDYSVRQGLLPELRHRGRRQLKKEEGTAGDLATPWPLAFEPTLPNWRPAWGIVVGGVGGTGVITIGQLLGMAAHLEGQGRRHAGRRRPGAEGRRHLGATSRSPTRRSHPHHQGRHRQGRPGDRLRPDRRRHQSHAGGDAARPHLRRA